MDETAARPKPLAVPGRNVCLTCREVLDFTEPPGVFTHILTMDGPARDHDPIPVPDLEFTHINEHCDFCFCGETEWVLPAKEFQTSPGHISSGDWGACGPCGLLIRAGKWGSLAKRNRQVWPTVHSGRQQPAELAQGVRLLWAELRKHVTGPIVRIER